MINKKYHLIFIMMILVSSFQIYNSHFSSLNSWRGGGFGMYTEPHWNKRTLWLNVYRYGDKQKYLMPIDQINPLLITPNMAQNNYLLLKCKIHPTYQNCLPMIEMIKKKYIYVSSRNILDISSEETPTTLFGITHIDLEVLQLKTEENSNGLFKRQDQVAQITYNTKLD